MPKRFRIEITRAASQDVAATHALIACNKPKAAAKWVRTIDRHIRSLRSMPERYEVIPEAEEIGVPYRHCILGSYRIIYQVERDVVIILRVFHAARILKSRHLES